MAKWKRSGADALREYEQSSNYVGSIGVTPLNERSTSEAGGKWKRSGADALREYEQSSSFPQTLQVRKYNAEDRNYDQFAAERYSAQVNAQRRDTNRHYQEQVNAAAQAFDNYRRYSSSGAAKNAAYQNYEDAKYRQELARQQMSGKRLTESEKHFLENPRNIDPDRAAREEAAKERAYLPKMENETEEMRRQQILGRQSEDLQKQIDALTQQEEERRKNTSLWEKIGRALSPIRSFRQEENDAEDAISKLKERKAEVDRQYQMDANQYKVYQTYQKSERPEAYTAENVGNYKQRLAALASVYGTWTKEQEQEAKEAIGTQSGGTGLLSAEKNVWAFAPYQEAVRKNDTESARQWEQIYNALYTRLYSGQEAVTSGLMQGLGFEALGDVMLHTSTEMADEAYDRWAEQKQNYAYAQSEHPYLASGARIAGSLALMSGVGKAAGAGLAATGLKTGSFWFNVARGSLTFAGVSAIQNSGAAASGDISGGDYLKSIAVSGAQGAAGNIAGELVGSGLATVLRKNGLMTPFFEFVRQTASSMSNATVNQAIGYAAADKKPTGQEIAEGLVTSFLFSALSSAISTYETTNAQKARMQQAYNQIESSYQAMAAGTENMTPEAKAQRVQLILQQTQNLRAATGEYYIAGQQKAVNNLNSALDAIEDWANNYLNGYQAAADAMQPKTALPGGTTGQIPSAPAQPPVDPNLTQEVANGLQTAITQGVIQADTPQPMTGGDAAAGAAQSISQDLQAQGLDAKTADALVKAATEMQQEAASAPSGGQNAAPTETVAPKQNTAQTPAQDAQESTAVNTNPAEHTKAEQAVIEAYKASADGQMRGFIEKVRSLQNNDYKNKISADVHTETTRAADTAGELTGTDTSGFKNIIKGNAVQHIDRRHGANGSADHSLANIDDFSRIGFVLDNFTDAELLPLNRVDAETAKLSREWMNSDNTQAPLVRFSMPVNGVFYVVEAVPSSKAKRLAVVSAYISRENKESTLKQVLNLSDTTGSGTPETPLAILDAPEKSLAQNGGTVKQTDASTLSSMAQTLGKSGQKAIFKAYDSKADTAEYAGEFVKVYNAARAGNDLPETKTLEPWQKYAAETAGKNDAEKVGAIAKSEKPAYTEDKNSVEYVSSLLESVNTANTDNYRFRIQDRGDGQWIGTITGRTETAGAVPVENARKLTYTSPAYASRQEAVKDILAVAGNNKLLTGGTSNGVQSVSDRQGVPESSVSGTGDGGLLGGVSAEDVQKPEGGRRTAPAVAAEGRTAGRDAGRPDETGAGTGSGVGVREGGHLQPATGSGRGQRGVQGTSRRGTPVSVVHVTERGGAGDSVRTVSEEPGEHRTGEGNDGVLTPETAKKPSADLSATVQREIREKTADSVSPKGTNYVIPEEGLKLPNGEKARYKSNVAAIQTLRAVMSENRMATPEEQAVLARYVGWGGIPNAFDSHKEDWAKEYRQLKGLLSESEWKAAMQSTTNAHFTSVEVIRAMYHGLESLGFTGGRVLEPSCGVGNFAGAMPASLLPNVKSLTMVELDEVTGNIAKALYPNAKVMVQGFETAVIPDNYMDLAIGNVPFGNYAIFDKAYPKAVTSSIHNYFFAKSIDKVRPGGVLCFITSRYTMDARDSSVREYMMQRADLLGAIRLPDTAFKANAGTDVVTDILVFKKRPAGTAYAGEAFRDVDYYHQDKGIWEQTNGYFRNHPEMVLGTVEKSGTMYRANGLTVKAKPGNLGKQIEKAFSQITGRMDYTAKPTQAEIQAEVRKEIRSAKSKAKNGSFVSEGGKLYQNQDGELVRLDLSAKQAEVLQSAISLRDTGRELLALQFDNAPAEQIEAARAKLNEVYDNFVQKNGPMNKPANKKIIQQDADAPFILALENYDAKAKTAEKAAIFTKNTITPHEIVSHVDTAADGIAASINETGGVDIPMIARLMGTDEKSVERQLAAQGLAYKQADESWQPAQMYLSGNVRAKLKEARGLANIDPAYETNVKALEKVVPADIPAQDISVRPGATWIPPRVYADFAAEILGSRNSGWRSAIDVTYSPITGTYKVDYGANGRYLRGNSADSTEYGAEGKTFVQIFEAALNSKDLKVYYPHGKDQKAVLNPKATIAVKEKKNKILSKFQEWMWSDENRIKEYGPLYNDLFNCMAIPNYDGSELKIDGLSAGFTLREHQANAVQRIIMSGGNTLLAHGTGAGKTLEMASAAMKLRQIGAVKKPMIIVPKNLLGQWEREFRSYYPAAKLLVPAENDFTPANRKTFANKVATGDYDAVIITYEHFERIPLSKQAQARYYQDQVDQIIAAQEEAKKQQTGKNFTVKQLAKKRAELEANIKKLGDVARDEDNIDFESLGVDSLFVDEAHNFKNLFYTTQMSDVADLGNKEGSKRANDLYMKVQYLQGLNGGRGVVFGTATPVMNSVVEMYSMQKYLQGDLLKQKGINGFDAWASEFGEVVDINKMKAGGDGYETKQSMSRYRNLGELQQLFRSFADVVTQAPGLKLPKVRTGGPIVVECDPSEAQTEYLSEIGKRADNIRTGRVDVKDDNILKVYGDGKKMSYTQRMIDPKLGYEEGGKILKCVDNVLKEYRASEGNRGTQLIFCDRGVPGGQDEKNGIFLYRDIKDLLVKGGIPENEIAYAQSYKTDNAKSKMQEMVNDGKIRVLIGSTQAMGTGLNIQKRAVAMHELNAPDRPGDIEQNRGRIVRQGNTNPEVSIYTYITKKTFDSRQWDNLKRKGAFIHQIIAGDYNGRTADGDGDFSASAAEIAAIASDNPLILEQNEISQKINRLEALASSHIKEVQEAKRKVVELPQTIGRFETIRDNLKADISARQDSGGDKFRATILGRNYKKRADAGEAINQAVSSRIDMTAEASSAKIGEFAGFDVYADNHGGAYLQGSGAYSFAVNRDSADGTVRSMENVLKTFEGRLEQTERSLSDRKNDLTKYEQIAKSPFEQQKELDNLRAREDEIMSILNPKDEQGAFVADDGVEKLVERSAGDAAADHSAEWTATRVGDEKQTPKPLSEIIAGIEHNFGINITTGHARGRVRGQYSKLDNGIRTKITNDLPTISHELGHALNREYGLTGKLTDAMRSELKNGLGDLKDEYKQSKWISEGLAEFLRKYLQNSETAAIDYPEFTKHFLNSLSQRDRALVENLADEVNAYYSLDADTAQSAIRLREDRVPTGDTTGDKLRAEASVLYQAWVDSLHGIKLLDEATGTNTYRLATNAAYSDAMAGQIITGNLTDANGQYVGPGLKAALQGINLKNKAEYRAFGEYLVVRHGPERLAEGMRVFADDRKNSTAFMNRRAAELEQQYPAFHDAAERLYVFQDQLKETWLVGTGLISEETGEEWSKRWKHYVPFNRAMPQGQGGAKRGFANQQNPIKRARGSGRDLVHPVDNIISNIVKVVNAGVRNNVMRRITDEAQRVGADAVFLEKIPTPMRGTRVDLTGVKSDLMDRITEKGWANANDFGEIVADIDDYMMQFRRGKAFGDVVTVLKNGKPEFWKVNDPLLLQSITEMSPSKVNGLVDAIGKMSHFMTSNITGNNIIWSIFSNLPRDLGTLMVYAKEPNRFKLLKEIGASYVNKLKGDSANPLYLEYLAMGGGKASYYSTDRDVAKKARKELVGKFTLNPLDWISYLGDMIEQGPRFATYKCLRERGVDPQTAFYEAMDVTTNFRRGGATSRQVNKFVPFFNAGVQGIDKHVRFLTGQDAPPEQRKRVVRNRMIAYFAASAGIAALFYLINNRDEESKKDYQQLSTYTKNSYFCIPMGDGKYFVIPKPRDLAVLTSAMESGLELGVGGNKHAFDGFWSYAASNYLPNVASDLAQGDIAAATGGLGLVGVISSMRANRDFLGRPIVSAGMLNLEPKDQYNDRTSKLAYWAGQAFNVSPQMTDYFFNNVLGGWWKYQKALFPVGEENRDLTLGVKNTYIKDNQYSQDLVNWLYSKSDTSSRASKSDPNNISKKITAKTDSNMTTFYGNYNKLSKSDTKSTAARGTRQLVLDMIREYQKATDNKSQTDAEKEVYAICEAHGDVDILPGVMNTSIKDADGKEYTLSAVDYVEFQTDYLGIYWESVSQALDGVKGDAQRYSVLKSVKDAAKEQAKVRALKRMGAKTTTEWGDKYSGFSTYDVAYVKANADADGNGKISQAEVEALLRKMDLTNAERADLWAATNTAWAEKNNPFR